MRPTSVGLLFCRSAGRAERIRTCWPIWETWISQFAADVDQGVVHAGRSMMRRAPGLLERRAHFAREPRHSSIIAWWGGWSGGGAERVALAYSGGWMSGQSRFGGCQVGGRLPPSATLRTWQASTRCCR
jgi:hypothetical protein